MALTRLGEIACARSGDKGGSANIGVIARDAVAFEFLRERLSSTIVHEFFGALGVQSVDRYELPNLGALNFVLHGVLGNGGSASLRVDAQGKALGQALLELEMDIPDKIIENAARTQMTGLSNAAAAG